MARRTAWTTARQKARARAQSAPGSLVKFFRKAGKAMQEWDPSLLVKPSVEAAGYALRLPLKQPLITAEALWDFVTDPKSETRFRDLFFTKPKSRQEHGGRKKPASGGGPRIM